jgi:AbrB family looped-hinge helix DNA binding protein
MSTVALSPKFQVVIPKAVRRALQLVAGQRLEVRVNAGHVELVPQITMDSLRGLCPGIDTHVPNDPETATWPGGCEPALNWVDPTTPAPKGK